MRAASTEEIVMPIGLLFFPSWSSSCFLTAFSSFRKKSKENVAQLNTAVYKTLQVKRQSLDRIGEMERRHSSVCCASLKSQQNVMHFSLTSLYRSLFFAGKFLPLLLLNTGEYRCTSCPNVCLWDTHNTTQHIQNPKNLCCSPLLFSSSSSSCDWSSWLTLFTWMNSSRFVSTWLPFHSFRRAGATASQISSFTGETDETVRCDHDDDDHRAS